MFKDALMRWCSAVNNWMHITFVANSFASICSRQEMQNIWNKEQNCMVPPPATVLSHIYCDDPGWFEYLDLLFFFINSLKHTVNNNGMQRSRNRPFVAPTHIEPERITKLAWVFKIFRKYIFLSIALNWRWCSFRIFLRSFFLPVL